MQERDVTILLSWAVILGIPLIRLMFAQCSYLHLLSRIASRLPFLLIILSLAAIAGFLMSGFLGLLGNSALVLMFGGSFLLWSVPLGPDETQQDRPCETQQDRPCETQQDRPDETQQDRPDEA